MLELITGNARWNLLQIRESELFTAFKLYYLPAIRDPLPIRDPLTIRDRSLIVPAAARPAHN